MNGPRLCCAACGVVTDSIYPLCIDCAKGMPSSISIGADPIHIELAQEVATHSGSTEGEGE